MDISTKQEVKEGFSVGLLKGGGGVHEMENCSQLQLKQTETFIYVTKHVAAHIGRGKT